MADFILETAIDGPFSQIISKIHNDPKISELFTFLNISFSLELYYECVGQDWNMCAIYFMKPWLWMVWLTVAFQPCLFAVGLNELRFWLTLTARMPFTQYRFLKSLYSDELLFFLNLCSLYEYSILWQIFNWSYNTASMWKCHRDQNFPQDVACAGPPLATT